MEFDSVVKIHAPREEVVTSFSDVSQLKNWKLGFDKAEIVFGNDRKKGCKAKLYYHDAKGKESIILETVVESNLPKEYDLTYETNQTYHLAENEFIEEGDYTVWKMHNEYNFNGLKKLTQIVSSKNKYINETKREMEAFKAYVEQRNNK